MQPARFKLHAEEHTSNRDLTLGVSDRGPKPARLTVALLDYILSLRRRTSSL
jgi:hypothetical protein